MIIIFLTFSLLKDFSYHIITINNLKTKSVLILSLILHLVHLQLYYNTDYVMRCDIPRADSTRGCISVMT